MYGTDDGLINYNAARGRSTMDELESADRDQLRQLASSTLDSMFEARFVGSRTSINQPDAWPRTGAAIQRRGLSDDDIPTVVEWATYELAHMIQANPDAFGVVYAPGTMVKRETVGPITTEYAVPVEGADLRPRIPLIEGMLTVILVAQDNRGVPTFLVL